MGKIFLSVTINIVLVLFVACTYDNILNLNELFDVLKSTNYSNPIIYLSINGNDDNPGTISEPVRTLSKAIELAGNKSEIHVTMGVYSAYRLTLKTSLYGGFSYDFSLRNSKNTTEIVGIGYGGDPLPTIQVIDAANIVIDGITVKAAESATNKPCAIYFQNCDSTVILQNSKIYGQLQGNAKGMSAIYIFDASPKILFNYIYGGELNIDEDAVNGIKAIYSNSLIQGNVIDAGKNKGCLHGIYSQYSRLKTVNNIIYGGESEESCYSCAIRTGQAVESWNSSGSEDVIQNNTLIGGIGNRTYAIIASQESRQLIKNNLIDGGYGSIVAIGVYVKTNDKPYIVGNTFQNCKYGTYEWNFGDYAPGDNSNCQAIRNNVYKSTVHILAHWYEELPIDMEHDVANLDEPVETQEGIKPLKFWGNIKK